MTIDISNNAARVNYTVASGVTQTSFSVPFEFFNDGDLSVYVDDVLKTITTHYTVSGGDGSTGTITMSVTGAASGSTVVISRSIAIERTSDFVTGVDINRAALNTQLDTLTAIAADNQDKANRSITAPNSEVNPILELPDADTRKGKLLGFDDTTGNVVTTATLSDISTLNAISADIGTLADIEDGTDATDAIQTVAGISSNVTTVAGISANVTTVAGISANVTTVADDTSNIGTVATNIADVNTAATNITEIQNASSNATTATTKASEAATSASNASTSETNAATSATAAATSATTATTKAGEASTSATNAATSETNAGNSATAAASSASAAATSETNAANSAAAAATALDNFDDRYLGSKASDPTVDNDGNALVSGALYFNSTANEMRVYDGANWIAASSAGTASLILYEYTATSGQTTFSGADDNSASLSYSVGNIQVVMNGIVLDPSDFTATSGTSVVLASGAATDDLVNIYAFKSFTVADTVSASAGGTFAGDVDITGTLTSDGLTVDGSGSISTGSSGGSAASNADDFVVEAGGDGGISILTPSTNTGTLFFGDNTASNAGQIKYSHSGGSFSFVTEQNTRMVIDSSGNVGIATTSPSNYGKFTVRGATSTVSYGTVSANFSDAVTGSLYVSHSSGLVSLITDQSLVLKTGTSVEAMRIDGSGHTLMGGATSSLTGSSASGLEIRSNGQLKVGGSAAVDNVILSTGTTGTKYFISHYQNGTYVGAIIGSGTGLSLSSASDYRLKENVSAMTGATERLKQLNPSRFNFISTPDTTVDGFLAHEVQAVVPEAVVGTRDAMRDEEYEVTPAVLDDDGNVVTEAVMGTRSVPDYQGIDQSKLVPLLTAALQEALTKIDAMETRLAALEAE